MKTISINPPPDDRRCEVCGKHVDDLQEFHSGVYDGSKLVKMYRPMAPESALTRWDTSDIPDDPGTFEKAFVAKYGSDAFDNYCFADQLICSIAPSWECTDCISLNDEEYFTKKSESAQVKCG